MVVRGRRELDGARGGGGGSGHREHAGVRGWGPSDTSQARPSSAKRNVRAWGSHRGSKSSKAAVQGRRSRDPAAGSTLRSWTGRCRAPPGPMIRRRGPWACCRDAPGTSSACGPPSVTNRGGGQSFCAAEQGGGDVLGFGRLWHGEMVGAGGCGEGLKGGAGDFGVRVWKAVARLAAGITEGRCGSAKGGR